MSAASNYPPGHPTGFRTFPVEQDCSCGEVNEGVADFDAATNGAGLDAPEECVSCGEPLDEDGWEETDPPGPDCSPPDAFQQAEPRGILSPEERSEILLSNIDQKDCGVIAVQAITKLSRPTALKLMLERGYDPATGTKRGIIERLLTSVGFRCEYRPEETRGTPATFATTNEYGLWLVYVERHVMALVEGDLHNSRGHWHSRLDGVTRVTGDCLVNFR